MGGALLGFGGMLYVLVSPSLAGAGGVGKLMAAATFPAGLSMITFTGTDLLTSNMMYHALPFFTHPDRNIQGKTLARIWSVSAAGNFIGSVAIAAVASKYCFNTDPTQAWAAALAVKKTSMPFAEAFVKGVCANWLVNVAITMALAARTAGGKIAAIWIPITTFVTLGFEHSVANMFFIPLGIFSGAAVGWGDMLTANMVPVILGNMVGATFFTSMVPWFSDWRSSDQAKAAQQRAEMRRGVESRLEAKTNLLDRFWNGQYVAGGDAGGGDGHSASSAKSASSAGTKKTC